MILVRERESGACLSALPQKLLGIISCLVDWENPGEDLCDLNFLILILIRILLLLLILLLLPVHKSAVQQAGRQGDYD